MKFSIDYKLHEHGWAEVFLSDGSETIDSAVTYLHDSLLELAQMAISIRAGYKEARCVFMDEPGELQFLIKVHGENANYEARWYKDWASWGMGHESEFEVLLKGVCPSKRIVQQITEVLWRIHQDIGVEKYKELWVEHEFPIAEYTELANA